MSSAPVPVEGAAPPEKTLPINTKKDRKQTAPKVDIPAQAEFIQHRLDVFDRLMAEYKKALAETPRAEIEITLPNGSVQKGKSFETTPASIARGISTSLFDKTVISEVDGELWDIDRPLEKSCTLKLLDFDHPEGKKVFWHSAAHVLGEACEKRLGCLLCNGPPTTDPPGFYYDLVSPNNKATDTSDSESIEKLAAGIVKEKQPFERLSMSKADLLEMFKYSKYKKHFIQERVPEGGFSTVYRCGPLIDFCRGPHVPHTGRIKAFAVLRTGSAHWLADRNNETVQRIAGIAFPNSKLLTEYKTFLAEAAKRNHRKIGTDQKLFFFDDVSPGSCFFLPHGTRIYNALLDLMKSEYKKRGYDEVMTPTVFKSDLWKTSGHWEHYEENIFKFESEKEIYAMKPMNCPSHCKVFAHSEVSYRQLPWRMADFGVLHRNEFSGALSGLTRVRRFCQDDAHIFCSFDHIKQEVQQVLDFIKYVFGLFGFTYKLNLSTRPEKYLGSIETWDNAESMLKDALDEFSALNNTSWEENPGDGAFYGPKIDITVLDALKRPWQLATVQLDFQLPQRFQLRYVASKDTGSNANPGAEGLPEGYGRPVMIHRAILGSFERAIAVLVEHTAGKWPFWISPRQLLVVPIMPAVNKYAVEVQKLLQENGFYADVDLSGNKFEKKIRTGQLEQYNFIFVVGAKEEESRTVNIRNRDDTATQNRGEPVPLQKAVEALIHLKTNRVMANKLEVSQ